MNKHIVVVIVAALLLLGVGIFSAMALSGRGGMTMPDGSTMPADQMTTTGGTHTMGNGVTMPGMGMEP